MVAVATGEAAVGPVAVVVVALEKAVAGLATAAVVARMARVAAGWAASVRAMVVTPRSSRDVTQMAWGSNRRKAWRTLGALHRQPMASRAWADLVAVQQAEVAAPAAREAKTCSSRVGYPLAWGNNCL